MLLLLLPTLLLAQDPPPVEEVEVTVEDTVEGEIEIEEVTPEEAVAQLKVIMKGKDPMEKVALLENVGRIPNKKVTKEVARGLKAKEVEVRIAAVQALRYNPDLSALKELLKVKKSKPILEDGQVAPEYFYALGQHRDKKALDVLSDGLWSDARNRETIRARILSIGRIRDNESPEALMSMLKSTGGRRSRHFGHMEDFRAAMGALMGVDQGGDQTTWITWWNDAKKKLQVTEDEWPLSDKRKQRLWDMLWMTPEEKEEARNKERERRKEGRGRDEEI